MSPDSHARKHRFPGELVPIQPKRARVLGAQHLRELRERDVGQVEVSALLHGLQVTASAPLRGGSISTEQRGLVVFEIRTAAPSEVRLPFARRSARSSRSAEASYLGAQRPRPASRAPRSRARNSSR